MQSQEQVVVASELRQLLGVDILPIFAVLFAQMAASCVSMSVALRDAADGKQVCPSLLFCQTPISAKLRLPSAANDLILP